MTLLRDERHMFRASHLLCAVAATLAAAAFAFCQPPDRREPTPDDFPSPAQVARWARDDARSLALYLQAAAAAVRDRDPEKADELDQQVRYYVYFSLAWLPPAERVDYIGLIDFAMNSLSLRKVFVWAEPVRGTNNALVRFKFDELRPTPDGVKYFTQALRRLGERGSGVLRDIKKKDAPEPYFHANLFTLEYFSGKVTRRVQERDKDGYKLYYHGDPDRPVMVDKEVTVKTPHVERKLHHLTDDPALAELALITHNDFPLFRADWFIFNALMDPAYRDFFGFETLDDVKYVARFHGQDDDQAVRAAVTISQQVAVNQRGVQFTPTSLGQYAETFDYLTSIEEDDLLEDLQRQRRDASEIIFNLPNTLQGYALVNGQDKVISFADPHVATDRKTRWRIHTVWNAVSCITCHVKGIKDVSDTVRLMANPKVALLVKRQKDFRKVVDKFSTPIEEPVLRGQATYTRAINIVSRGRWTPAQFANKFNRAFLRWAEDEVTVADAARELGRPLGRVQDVIGRTRGAHHSFGSFSLGQPVRRDQWENKGYVQLAVALDTADRQDARRGGGRVPRVPPLRAPRGRK
jgi:hypothetical protein